MAAETQQLTTDDCCAPLRDLVAFAAPANLADVPAIPALESGTFDAAAAAKETYIAAVGAAVSSWSDADKTAFVEPLMQLFNAENYTGELSKYEREQADVKAVLTRFDPVFPDAAALDKKRARKLEGEAQDEEIIALEKQHAEATARKKILIRMLTVDGETPSVCVRYPGLFLACLGVAETMNVSNIWRLRVFLRHQQCLTQRAHSVFLKVADSIDALVQTEDPSIALEVGFAQTYYQSQETAGKSFFKAKDLTGLKVEETSMLGVRTRWQVNQHVQSVVNAESVLPLPAAIAAEDRKSMPVMVGSEREGHDLFDRPREDKDAEAMAVKPLHPTDHAVVLALCNNIRNTNPAFGLVKHRVQTFVERLLVDETAANGTLAYPARAQALLLRARLEAGRTRVQERAFLQMQELVDTFDSRRHPLQPTMYRAADASALFTTAFPSAWALRSEFAGQCMDENLHKTALALLEEIQDWPKIIECCTQLDKRRKAEMLARDLLEQEPDSPQLWVALGEVTRNEEYLWKAWELCGGKMAAPMRALAKLALEREQYEKVVEYFDKAVNINPVFGGDWFSLGYASLKLRKNERALEAFTRVCQIDPDNAYAWTNLGSILLRAGKRRPAFNALSQALRNNRNSWQMWQNYFSVGAEILEVNEATHALRTAVEIAGRDYVIESESMIFYTAAVLQYLRGEIRVSDNKIPGEDDGGIAAHATAEEEEDLEEVDIQPLLAEEELDPAFAAREAEMAAENARAEARGRERFRGRVKDLYMKLVSLFVDNHVLYGCTAELMAELEGPAKDFEYRLKQVREAERGDWHRGDSSFVTVVKAIECLTRAAVLIEGEEGAQARQQAVQAIDHALAQAEDHQEEHDKYRALQVLRMKTIKSKGPQ